MRCFAAFYREFLRSLDLNRALIALRDADNSNPSTWKMQTAEVFFAYMFGEYLNQRNSPEQLRQREDDYMATLILRGHVSQPGKTRRLIRQILHDFHADFDRMKKRFLMLDLFPENAPRFPLTYDQAIWVHAQVRQIIEEEQLGEAS
jgi:hypothetical protein